MKFQGKDTEPQDIGEEFQNDSLAFSRWNPFLPWLSVATHPPTSDDKIVSKRLTL